MLTRASANRADWTFVFFVIAVDLRSYLWRRGLSVAHAAPSGMRGRDTVLCLSRYSLVFITQSGGADAVMLLRMFERSWVPPSRVPNPSVCVKRRYYTGSAMLVIFAAV